MAAVLGAGASYHLGIPRRARARTPRSRHRRRFDSGRESEDRDAGREAERFRAGAHAERVLEHPVLGIGADSTPAARAKTAMPAEKPKGFVQARTTGHQAHNLFLQSWYELGLLGAVLAAVAGAATALRILLLPEPAQPFGAAAFTLFAVIAAFAWGMWQVWLVAAVGLLALYLVMTAAPYGQQHFPDAEDEP